MLVAVVTKTEEIEKVKGLADLIELRLDHFEDLDNIPKTPLPSIFTLRKKEQGGVRSILEKERLALIEKVLEKEPAYCDIEADTDPAFIAKREDDWAFEEELCRQCDRLLGSDRV